MNAKGKKLIVPVIAIMMCAIALAGVAYAATQSTVTSNNDSIDYGAFKIDLTTNGTTEVDAPWFSNAPVVDFGRVKVVGNDTPTWNVALHGSNVVASAKVKVTAEANHAAPNNHTTFTLKASITDLAAGVSAVVTFKAQYSTDGETWNDIGEGVASLAIGTTYDVRVVATIVSDNVSASVYSAFASANKTMNVTFTAEFA